MTKTRGLKQVKSKIGDITSEIDKLLKKNKQIHIFELGVGVGNALMALGKKYGKRVLLSGMNLKKSHGIAKRSDFIKHSLNCKVIKKSDLNNISCPKIYLGDAGVKIPLEDNSVDFVYSITTFFFIPDKAHAIEEIYRILKPRGIAVIHFKFKVPEFPKEYQNLFCINKDKKKINIDSYFKNFDDWGIKLKKTKYPGVRILLIDKIKNSLNLGLKFNKQKSIKLSDVGYQHEATMSVFEIK